jgi:hypothetical protein
MGKSIMVQWWWVVQVIMVQFKMTKGRGGQANKHIHDLRILQCTPVTTPKNNSVGAQKEQEGRVHREK